MSPASLLGYGVTALILGWLRWRSGATTVQITIPAALLP
jgi:hypothetical protein